MDQSLEVWEAEYYEQLLSGGRTQPLVLGCVRKLEEQISRRSFVVKALGRPEVAESGLFSETLGNILARHFGIQTPHPVLVNISPAFSSTIEKSDSSLRVDPGIGAGTEFLKGFTPRPDFDYRLPRQIQAAAQLFAFDMLTQNPDRTAEGKPNCGEWDNKIMAIDFELCFSFRFMLKFARQDAWKIENPMTRKHLFYQTLRGKIIDWEPFLSGLNALDLDAVR